MKTIMTNNYTEADRKWYLVDATDMPLGRLASQVAAILRGKNKPEFTPSSDCGDHVIVINSDKIVLTGRKMEQKFYIYHTGYVGGLKKVGYDKMLKEKSDFAVYEAIRGMLPKNAIGRQMIHKLRVYKDANHGHEAQMPKEIKIVGKRV
ncbi:MAG: 50S ribosomal protein L13 [Clostridia bacterium]